MNFHLQPNLEKQNKIFQKKNKKNKKFFGSYLPKFRHISPQKKIEVFFVFWYQKYLTKYKKNQNIW